MQPIKSAVHWLKHNTEYAANMGALALLIGLILLGVVDTNASVILIAILAAVTFLVGKTLKPPVSQQDLDEQLKKYQAMLAQELAIAANRRPPLDTVLEDREAYRKKPFIDRIKNARRVYLQGASLIHLLTEDHLNGLIDHVLKYADGEVRLLLQYPGETAAMEYLYRQLDEQAERRMTNVKEAIPELERRLRSMKLLPAEKYRLPGKFELRYLTYSPGFSLVIIDPNERHGVVIPEFYGFRNDSTGKRMHIEINRQESDYWFDYWEKQFEAMWNSAHTICLDEQGQPILPDTSPV